MKVVGTIRGLIDRTQLQLYVMQRELVDGLMVAAEWRLMKPDPEDVCVKRDGHVLMFASPGEQAQAKLLGQGMVVSTARGLIPRDQLQVSIITEETENAVMVSTEWRVKADGPDAPHVRRDSLGVALASPEVQTMASLGQIPAALMYQPTNDVTVQLAGSEVGVEQHKFAQESS